jgi:lipopolysaccharide/colanic/teichoic acid biosynthesis glycosyltransferase
MSLSREKPGKSNGSVTSVTQPALPEPQAICAAHRSYFALKRGFDVFAALCLLVLLGPTMLLCALIVKLYDGGPVFFRQERLTGGPKGPRRFRICKFRTMVIDAEGRGRAITCSGDSRITPVGAMLRKFKLDEIPQLFNVLAGDMAFVGPRPQVARVVEMAPEHFQWLHSIVAAGVTDAASLEHRDEEELLAGAADPEALYRDLIMPSKIASHRTYIRRMGPWEDTRLVLATLGHYLVAAPLQLMRSGSTRAQEAAVETAQARRV